MIWSTRHFDSDWQLVVDLFNSFPLIGLGAVIAWRARATAALAFFGSMALHCVTDLLVHREDAHAHLFPLSSWRFFSPVSYWDLRHYGWLVGPLELLVIVAGAAVLLRSETRAWRVLGRVVLASSLLSLGFALTAWMN